MMNASPPTGPVPEPAQGSVPEPALAPPARRRPSRRRLYLLLTYLAVLGAAQEVVFRLAFPLPDVPSFNRINYTPLDNADERADLARTTGLGNLIYRWESEPDGFVFDHTLNLSGFRGPNVAPEPPGDRDRVLFVGDSYVEGVGAADEDTIPEQFTRALAGTRPVQAINLGINGVGFPEYVRLVRDGLAVFPQTRAVFLVVYVNDLPAPAYAHDLDDPPPKFERRNLYVPRVLQAIGRLARGEGLPRWYYTGPAPFFEPVPSPGNPLSEGGELPTGIDPEILDAMRRGKANPWLAGTGDYGIVQLYADWLKADLTDKGSAAPFVKRIAALCADHGARLILVYMPYHAIVNRYYLAAHNRLGGKKVPHLVGPKYYNQPRHLRAVAEELGVTFLDATPAFISAERSGVRTFWPIDTHCTAAGYEVLAKMCAACWTQGDVSAAPQDEP